MESSPKVLILIPSRYQSSRFPGKSLCLLTPKNSEPITLVEQVYMNCVGSGYETAVVTDNPKIEDQLVASGKKVLRIDDDVPSGTERIALAYKIFFKEEYDFIINVQGDEPLLKSDDLKNLIQFHAKGEHDIATMVRAHQSKDEFDNPNIVKVAMSDEGRCLYFSRSGIPYERNPNETWYQHIGIYSYKPAALKKFIELKISSLEKVESLEQLRALENNMSIGAVETTSILMGIDTPEDLEKVNMYLQQGDK